MKLLVTAGNTRVLLDQVRCLTNVFTGRTGTAIALEAYRRGHQVTLLTSHPEVVNQLPREYDLGADRWRLATYATFEDLQNFMATQLADVSYDGVIHSAAVSDYLFGGVYAPAPGTRFDDKNHVWRVGPGSFPTLEDRSAPKIKSTERDLWVRLCRAPKLIDRVRSDWGFRGTLVKFKLEVGIGEEELRRIAEESRLQSQANLMVANTLEGMASWALVGPSAEGYAKIARADLPARLLDAVEGVTR